MKIISIKTNLFICLLGLVITSNAQLAEVTVTLKTVNITSYKPTFLCERCWEAGNQEYTSIITAWTDGAPSANSSGCQSCDMDGNCTYAQDLTIFTNTGIYDSIIFRLNSWENNDANRCTVGSDDGCLSLLIGGYNFRLLSESSNGTYTNSSTYTKYGVKAYPCSPEWYAYQDVTFKTTWKYSGTESLIEPACTVNTAAFGSGLIPSWTAYLYGGVDYNFNTCSSSSHENTYIRIYGSDGYTKVAANDNSCGEAPSINFTPTTSGYYYIEVSHTEHSFTESAGILEYHILAPSNQSCNSAIAITPGSNTSYQTICSSQDAPAQTCGGNNVHKDVWFKFTPTSSGAMELNTCSKDEYNSRISVYSGTCGVLALAGCSDDASFCGSVNTSARVNLNVCKGTTYYISVGGTNGESGPGVLSMILTPTNTLPSITCPANIFLFNTTNLCGRIYNYVTPVGTDNCPNASTVQTSGFASGATFPLGVTKNTFVVTDLDGDTTSCSFTVTVKDVQIPTITCPAAVHVTSCAPIQVIYPNPVTTDNCSNLGITLVQTAGIASDQIFPIGTTTNTFYAKDATNNVSSTCSFDVIVSTSGPPTITCPSDFVVNANNTNPSACNVNSVNYPISYSSEGCGSLTFSMTSGNPPGSSFNFGTTVNTIVVTDSIGRTASCSFSITVVDNQKPTITCPANISVSPATGNCSKTVTYSNPAIADNCFAPSYPTLSRTAGLASGAAYPVGTTTNTFTATDFSGNKDSCSFTVTVMDAEAPMISCPANISVSATTGTCGAIVSYTAPNGTDNCSGQNTIQTAGLPSGGLFPEGTTTNSFTVTDVAGLTANCSFAVTVTDTEVPKITCPPNISVNTSLYSCNTTVNYVTPTASDNCYHASYPAITETAGLANGATFPIGTTMNRYTATDFSGNKDSCSFTVTVIDAEAPNIACPENFSVNAYPGTCGDTVYYTAPLGTDNCAGQSTIQTVGLSGGKLFPEGTTTNTFIVTDAAGNTSSCSFTVTVLDAEAPKISCPANITVSGVSSANPCVATVSYTPPVGTDNCTGPVTSRIAGLDSGSAFPEGETVVTYKVIDAAGNIDTCSFTVNVGNCTLTAVINRGIVNDGILKVLVYPNPFTHTTTISFTSAVNNKVKLDVLNTSGSVIETLYEGPVKAKQEYKFEFNAKRTLPAGVYFYRLQSDDGNEITDKLILLK